MCDNGISIVYERLVALYNKAIFVWYVENRNTIFDLYLAKSSHTEDKFLKGNVGLFCVLCTLPSTVSLAIPQILIAAKRNLPFLLTHWGFLWKKKKKGIYCSHLDFCQNSRVLIALQYQICMTTYNQVKSYKITDIQPFF